MKNIEIKCTVRILKNDNEDNDQNFKIKKSKIIYFGCSKVILAWSYELKINPMNNL